MGEAFTHQEKKESMYNSFMSLGDLLKAIIYELYRNFNMKFIF